MAKYFDPYALKKKFPLSFALVTLIPSLIYAVLIFLRTLAYDKGLFKAYSFSVPVISVGNIAVGGTGKTPFVIYLCKMLQEMGERPAILSRGYHIGLASGDSCAYLDHALVLPPVHAPDRGLRPDEALLQSAKLPGVPVVLGANRWIAAQRFLKHAKNLPTVWVLDDGFQHRAIKRDVDIVMLGDVQRRTDFSLLPKSFFREPLSSLQRSSISVAPCTSDIDFARSLGRTYDFTVMTSDLAVLDPVPVNQPAKVAVLERGAAINLWCAIANPDRFVAAVKSLGYSVINAGFAGDHSEVSVSDVKGLEASGRPVFITEKDYFRSQSVWERAQVAIYVIPIVLTLIPADDLSFRKYLSGLFRS